MQRKNPLNNQSGAAMIIALCFIAVLLAMGLALLFSASAQVSAANLKYQQELCAQLAKSFSLALRDQLDAKQVTDGSRTVLGSAAAGDGSLTAQLYLLTEALTASDEESAALRFSSAAADEQYGTVSVSLRKEEYSTGGEGMSAYYDYTIYLKVRVEKGQASFEYPSVYLRYREKPAQYTYNGQPVTLSSDGRWLNQWGAEISNLDETQLEVSYGDDTAANCRYSFEYQYGG